MIYKCRNCSGNMVFMPEKQQMYCPYCDSVDSQEMLPGENMHTCTMCGASIPVGTYDSAGKCPACSQYVIFDERISGEYEPKKIQPFMVGKDIAKKCIRQEFGDHMYMPDSFLEEVSLQKIEGVYVPFWLYNFEGNFDFEGTGTKTVTHTIGNVQNIETSYYQAKRNFDVSFTRMPQDASEAMPNDVMDLMEPYDYSTLKDFDPKYMSGFLAEIYCKDATIFEPRAAEKAKSAAEELLKESLYGYSGTTANVKNLTITGQSNEYALLPVWRYLYQYRGKEYPYYINGQTGKVVGEVPVSPIKRVTYPLTVFFLLCFGSFMILYILGGIL